MHSPRLPLTLLYESSVCQYKLSELHNHSMLTSGAKYVVKVSPWLHVSFILYVFRCLLWLAAFQHFEVLVLPWEFPVNDGLLYYLINAPSCHVTQSTAASDANFEILFFRTVIVWTFIQPKTLYFSCRSLTEYLWKRSSECHVMIECQNMVLYPTHGGCQSIVF